MAEFRHLVNINWNGGCRASTKPIVIPPPSPSTTSSSLPSPTTVSSPSLGLSPSASPKSELFGLVLHLRVVRRTTTDELQPIDAAARTQKVSHYLVGEICSSVIVADPSIFLVYGAIHSTWDHGGRSLKLLLRNMAHVCCINLEFLLYWRYYIIMARL
jgi:hypothetical protein